MDRLDEEKLEMLRTWGEGLLNDGRDELRAAGKAILILVEEIEQLHVDLWHARQDTAKKAEIQRAESEGSCWSDSRSSRASPCATASSSPSDRNRRRQTQSRLECSSAVCGFALAQPAANVELSPERPCCGRRGSASSETSRERLDRSVVCRDDNGASRADPAEGPRKTPPTAADPRTPLSESPARGGHPRLSSGNP
jgi:hypothetical protein